MGALVAKTSSVQAPSLTSTVVRPPEGPCPSSTSGIKSKDKAQYIVGVQEMLLAL